MSGIYKYSEEGNLHEEVKVHLLKKHFDKQEKGFENTIFTLLTRFKMSMNPLKTLIGNIFFNYNCQIIFKNPLGKYCK